MKKTLLVFILSFVSVITFSQATFDVLTGKFKYTTKSGNILTPRSVSYVDSISVTPDSLIYYNAGVRIAYLLPSGGGGSTDSSVFATQFRLDSVKANLRAEIASGSSSNWTVSGSDIYRNSKVTIGGSAISSKLHVILDDDPTPSSFSSGNSKKFSFGQSGPNGGGLYGSVTASTQTVNLLAIAPNLAWWNILMQAAGFNLKNSGGTSALSMDINANVGVGNVSNIYSTVQNGGSIGYSHTVQAGNYSITANDYAIEYNAGGGNTYTLPSAAGIDGRVYVIIHAGEGTLNIATTSSQTFVNISGSPTSIAMTSLGSRTVMSNGSNWMVIGSL